MKTTSTGRIDLLKNFYFSILSIALLFIGQEAFSQMTVSAGWRSNSVGNLNYYNLYDVGIHGIVGGHLKLVTGKKERLTILYDGKLGIGTPNPAELLELKSSNPILTFHKPSTSSFKMGNDGTVFKIAAMDNGFGGHDGNFGTNDTQVISMANNGNVGIGTISPGSYKLAVEGKIGARGIDVKVGSWADFVFEKDYALNPLTEVASFIEKNKHLPDVPSEAEVLEKGIDLAKMDAILLRKIEELTLYVIELKKENEALKKAMSHQ